MMSRRSYASLAVAALAVATVCVAVEPASAQYGRRGFNGGYSSWNGWGSGAYNPYGDYSSWNGWAGEYGNPYGGYATWNRWGMGSNNQAYGDWYGPGSSYSSGWNSSPAYSGYGWGTTPGYSGSGNEYASGNPSYYGEGMGTQYSQPSNAGVGFGYGQEAYGAMSNMGGERMGNHVLITVRVPPNAQVWFDDQKTNQMGSLRAFVSPPLSPDRDFVYHIRAHWTENGQPVDKTRRIDVHAGDRLLVNFFSARQGMGGSNAGQRGTSGQFGTQPGATGTDRNLENRDRGTPEENTDRTPDNRTGTGNSNATTPSGNTNPSGTTGGSSTGTNTPAQPRSQNQTQPPHNP